jgi:hypothetical protein
MKIKFTLFYFLLVSTISFSQNGKPCGVLNMEDKLKAMFQPELYANSAKTFSVTKPVSLPPTIDLQKTNQPILNNVFYRLTGSYNIFGNLYSNSKPLQYHRILNAYSFITRKSPTYNPVSDGNEGTVVGYVGKNDATTNSLASWDSTCLWTSTLNIARDAVGGIWNTIPGNGNTDINKSIIVASGSTKSGTTITGSFRASKIYSLTPKNAPGADVQFFSNTAPFSSATSTSMAKHDLPSFSFNSCDNAVFSIGPIFNDVNASTDVAKGLRGAMITRGTFNSGVMVWTSDSIIPPTVLKTDGTKLLWYQPYMTWNPSGTVGYIVFIGCRQGAPLNSSIRGMQPIIYKTTNAGNSWVIVNGIDFTNPTPTMNYVLNSLDGVNTNTVVKVPYFDPSEGIDINIDCEWKLHIVGTVKGTAKQHVDSLSYVHQYAIGTETYSSPYYNTKRPYILDFVGDGMPMPWQCRIIDSADTECPSNISTMPGFTNNPWANNSQPVPVSSGMRIQTSESYGGDYIIYSWAETDTLITTNSGKWNEYPNVKLRALRVCDGSLSAEPGGFNVTGATGVLAAVKDKAYFHYLSTGANYGSSITATSATIMIGMSVTRNNNSDGSLPVNHYFSSVRVGFSFTNPVFCGLTTFGCAPTNINHISNNLNSIDLYPNPSFKEITINLTSSENKTYAYNITDLAGKQIRKGELSGNKNNSLNVSELTQGVYIFNVLDAGRIIGVKKFVKE